MKNVLSEADYQELIDRYFARLSFFASGFDVPSPEDIVQTAFLRLVEYSSKEDAPEHISSWLYKTVRNESLDQLRKKRRGRLVQKYLAQRESTRLIDDCSGLKNDLDVLSSSVSSNDVQEALDSLDSSSRELVHMYIWGDLTFEQIAVIVHSSRATVYRRYRFALKQLNERLNPP